MISVADQSPLSPNTVYQSVSFATLPPVECFFKAEGLVFGAIPGWTCYFSKNRHSSNMAKITDLPRETLQQIWSLILVDDITSFSAVCKVLHVGHSLLISFSSA